MNDYSKDTKLNNLKELCLKIKLSERIIVSNKIRIRIMIYRERQN